MALPGAYAPASIALWVIGARKPLHDKAAVLDKGEIHILLPVSECTVVTAVKAMSKDWGRFLGAIRILIPSLHYLIDLELNK
jgi:hypothetical protein